MLKHYTILTIEIKYISSNKLLASVLLKLLTKHQTYVERSNAMFKESRSSYKQLYSNK